MAQVINTKGVAFNNNATKETLSLNTDNAIGNANIDTTITTTKAIVNSPFLFCSVLSLIIDPNQLISNTDQYK